jgi:serine/threonine protein phosphatase 1
MSIQLAFVGDVHGNLPALRGLWSDLVHRQVRHVVFLGDYLNKGPQTAEVLQQLISYSKSGRATLLAGNHETALIDALDRRDLSGFLKIGGAMTIRSYVGGRVGPDVLGDFLNSFPPEHLEAVRLMPLAYETEALSAEHIPSRERGRGSKFRISAHTPVGDLPRIGRHSAELDTGCGATSGRLTALLWPSLAYIQVDAGGVVLKQE